MKISEEHAKRLVETYSAFYKMALSGKDTELSGDQLRAIGQNVIDELVSQACKNAGATIEQEQEFRDALQELLEENFPLLLSDTPLGWDKNGFYKK